MKIVILLALVTISSAQKKCQGIYFSDRFYNIEVLKDGVNKITKLELNRNDNTLYFAFEQIGTTPNKAVGYLRLDTKEAGVIDGIRNATSVAIDQEFNIVYVGGSDGVYTINKKHVPERLPIRDNIESLYFKEYLYYTNRRKEAFKYVNGYPALVHEIQGTEVDYIIVDDDDNLFYIQNNRIFTVKLGTRAVNTFERYIVDVMTTNSYYKPYICTRDGIYAYNKYKYAMDKVSGLTNLKALTFNKMLEPIYGIADVIIKLHYNGTSCHEY